MAYPLAVNPRSASVDVVPADAVPLVLELTVTRSAGWGLPIRTPRTAAIEIVGVTAPTKAVPTSGQFIPPIVEPF